MQQWLEGIRVLDLSRLLPGPFCSLLLADMGADVVKIEDTGGGDYARYYPPLVDGTGAFFASINRNKRAMTLNLKTPEGVEVLQELASGADVVLESFRPGVMDRLGVGYEALRERNPGLIYCAITGYGASGPLRDRAGHDINYLSRAGLLEQNGRAGESPVTAGFQLGDIAGGSLYAALGIVSALFGRERGGGGAFLDISMTEGALSFAIPAIANVSAGAAAERGRGMLTGGVPSYDVYETSDGRHISVGALEPKFWMQVVQAVGRPDLMGEGLDSADAGARAKEELRAVFRTKTLDEWTEILAPCDACCEPLLTFDEVLADEHHRARQMFFQLAGVTHVRTPVTPLGVEHRPPPARGEHTRELLVELGMDEARIAALAAAGAIS